MTPIKGRFELRHVGVRNHTGIDDRALRKAAAKGTLTRVRRGVYVHAATWKSLGPLDRYRLVVAAAAEAATGPLTISHRSAAVLWGVPLVGRYPDVVDVLTSVASGARTEHGFARHTTRDHTTEVTTKDGIALTSLPRTVVDLAAALPFPEAVAAVDWALANGCKREHLADLTRRLGNAASGRGLSVIAFADRRAGSPGESISRALMHQLGFPPPELQVPFRDGNGLIGVVDFYWADFALIGEFDGGVKYADPTLLGGRSPSAVVVDEKRREDRLRALGPRVTRWVWDDLSRERLGRQLTLAGLPRFSSSTAI